MDRTTKVTAVGELTEIFSASGSVVLARYSGLTVAEMTKLRGELRAKGGRLKTESRAQPARQDRPEGPEG